MKFQKISVVIVSALLVGCFQLVSSSKKEIDTGSSYGMFGLLAEDFYACQEKPKATTNVEKRLELLSKIHFGDKTLSSKILSPEKSSDSEKIISMFGDEHDAPSLYKWIADGLPVRALIGDEGKTEQVNISLIDSFYMSGSDSLK